MRQPIRPMRRVKYLAAAGTLALMGMGLPAADAAVITVGNTGSSGPIAAAAGNESGSMSFNNNGSFLAVVLTVSASSGLSVSSAPTVSYNSTALTPAATYVYSDYAYSAVYYLNNPAAGDHPLSVNFGADILQAGYGAWEFGALSLSNVKSASPVAAAVTASANGLTSWTITSPTPGAISAGDLLLLGNAASNSIPNPNWTTAAGSQISLYYNGTPAGAGARDYNGEYAKLVAGDLSGANSDQVVLSSTQSRVGARALVVFDAIPEPSALAMLGIAAAGLMFRRRRGGL